MSLKTKAKSNKKQKLLDTNVTRSKSYQNQ